MLLASNVAKIVDASIPLGICVVLPIMIVWLVGRVRQHETDRKTEIMLKAMETGIPIPNDLFKRDKKLIKEKLIGRLTGACVTGFIGIAGLLIAFLPDWEKGWGDDWMTNSPAIIALILGGILLAVGIGLFVAYFVGKKMLAGEMAAEEKQLSEGK
ncbi:MAG: hypothetical protein IJU13_08450 [Bacteroidales bacterium]|nr:hypothetical protein [Bacteroidales bacterium]